MQRRIRPLRSLNPGAVASLVLLFANFFFSPAAVADTVLYVDPDWTGTATGAAATPWTSLNASAWTTINATLTIDDVTIYFSARAASADTHQTTTTALSIARTDTSTHRLTLDGMSQYNTNDAAPSWAPYSGASRFSITAGYPISTDNIGGPERTNWTLRGFRAIATSGQPIFLNMVRNIIVEDSEFTTTSTVTLGPAFILGSSSLTGFAGTNVTIRRNHVHHTYGEGIYIGGWYGLAPGVGAGDTLLIEDNTIHDMAVRGGEGDGIDIKDGWTNVIVRNNTIYMTTEGSGEDGIITNSAAIIEDNFVYNMGRNGIDLAGFYAAYDGFWTGVVIRNNIVVNCGLGASYSYAHGISYPYATGSYSFVTPQIYNNTVYRTREKPANFGVGRGIYIDPSVLTTVAVFNNIAVGTEGIDFEAGAGRLSTHGNNNYWHVGTNLTVARYGSASYTSATLAEFEGNSLSVDPLFVSTDPPYIRENFYLQAASPLCGRNMGAVQATQLCATGAYPQPPTNLRLQ